MSVYWAGKNRKNSGLRLRKLPEVLEQWKQRFRQVKLESCKWQEILKRYDDPQTFFFVDPPYHPETLDRRLYQHDLTAAEHEELLKALRNVQGKVLLCGYDHKLYRKHLPDWRRIEFQTRSTISAEKSPRTEIIWLNFDETGSLLTKTPATLSMPRRKNAKCDQEGSLLTKTCTLPMTHRKSSKSGLSEIDQELLEGIELRRKTLATMIRGVRTAIPLRSSFTVLGGMENQN